MFIKMVEATVHSARLPGLFRRCYGRDEAGFLEGARASSATNPVCSGTRLGSLRSGGAAGRTGCRGRWNFLLNKEVIGRFDLLNMAYGRDAGDVLNDAEGWPLCAILQNMAFVLKNQIGAVTGRSRGGVSFSMAGVIAVSALGIFCVIMPRHGNGVRERSKEKRVDARCPIPQVDSFLSVTALRRARERKEKGTISSGSGPVAGLAYVAPIGVQVFRHQCRSSQPRRHNHDTDGAIVIFDVTLACRFFGIGALIEHNDSELIRRAFAGWQPCSDVWARLMLSANAGPAINVNIPLMKTIGMACVVTWFNPQAIIDVSLLLGSFRVALPPEESGLFLWGVVCASCLWFLSLTTISSLFKNRFTPRLLRIINLVCGLVFFYGVKLGWSFVELWQSAF